MKPKYEDYFPDRTAEGVTPAKQTLHALQYHIDGMPDDMRAEINHVDEILRALMDKSPVTAHFALFRIAAEFAIRRGQ